MTADDPVESSAIDRPVRLGLRSNLGQFTLLVAVNALVGGMVGQERTVLPLLATDVFGLTGFASALTFVVAFGLAKAATNLAAGALADRFGRKPVLVAGWLIGLPVPLLLISRRPGRWVVAANLLLGVNQGLTWSTTVIMKIDLVGPIRRGLATGLNEAAGYVAVAMTALATGWIAASVRPSAGAVPPRAGRTQCLVSAHPCCSSARRAVTSSTNSAVSRRADVPSWREVFCAHHAHGSQPLGGVTGRARQQPQ